MPFAENRPRPLSRLSFVSGPEVAQHNLGDFAWSDPSRLRIDNTSDQPLETVILELKTIY